MNKPASRAAAAAVFILIAGALSAEKADNFTIGRTGIGAATIGSSYEKFLKFVPHSGVLTNEYKLVLTGAGGKWLVSINDKNWGKTGIVKSIDIHSPSFSTREGIHTGMSVTELTNILGRESAISFCGGDSTLPYEYFAPPSLQTTNASKEEPGIVFLIMIVSTDGSLLGRYSETDLEMGFGTAREFGTNGTVSLISIYDWR